LGFKNSREQLTRWQEDALLIINEEMQIQREKRIAKHGQSV
jgi:hypothetical protein